MTSYIQSSALFAHGLRYKQAHLVAYCLVTLQRTALDNLRRSAVPYHGFFSGCGCLSPEMPHPKSSVIDWERRLSASGGKICDHFVTTLTLTSRQNRPPRVIPHRQIYCPKHLAGENIPAHMQGAALGRCLFYRRCCYCSAPWYTAVNKVSAQPVALVECASGVSGDRGPVALL